MGGLPADTRVCPEEVAFRCDKQKMLDRWATEVGHNTQIRVCAACGGQNMMTDEECRVVDSKNRILDVLAADEAKLPAVGSLRWDAMHLVAVFFSEYSLSTIPCSTKPHKNVFKFCPKWHHF